MYYKYLTMETNLDTPGKRLQWLLTDLDVTPYAFAKSLGYKSPDTVYHIINGINGMSKAFLNKIELKYYNINVSWLLTGRGVPFGSNLSNILPGRYYSGYIEISPVHLDHHYFKLLSEKVAGMIFENGVNEDYIVSVRTCGISAVEFVFTTYIIIGNERTVNRKYSAILQPNWKFTCLFEYLKPDGINQTALDLSINKDKAGVSLLDALNKSIQPLLIDLTYYFSENEVESFLMDDAPYRFI